MNWLIYLRTVCVVCFAAILLLENSLGQVEQLANRVPATANAIVVVNVQAAYASPMAHAKDWNQSGPSAHEAGMIPLPASAEWFLMAAQMDYEFMHPLWEIAVAYVREMPSMKDIATRSGGRVDQLAGAQAVERPNDSYVVTLGPRIIGAMSPANRQQVIHWVRRSSVRKSPQVTEYLLNTLDGAKRAPSQILMVLDLHGLLAPEEISAVLALQKTFAVGKGNSSDVRRVVAGIKGVRLAVELQNPPLGELRVDFSEDAWVLSEIAKPMILGVLRHHGASIDEIGHWSVRVDGPSIVMEGELSSSGLRRVLNVLSGPVGPMSASAGEVGSSGDAVALASQRYFQSITNYLNDLFLSGRQPENMYQAKVWIDRYARKINDLNTHQVDKDLLSYGADVVSYLQQILAVIQRSQQRTDIWEANLYASGDRPLGRYGAYGYYVKPDVARDRELIQTNEALRGERATQEIIADLHELTNKTREEMTKRYQINF